MKFWGSDEDDRAAVEREAAERAVEDAQRARQREQADKTGIWSFRSADPLEVPWHKCLRCGVPVFDKEAHLAWHMRVGDPWP